MLFKSELNEKVGGGRQYTFIEKNNILTYFFFDNSALVRRKWAGEHAVGVWRVLPGECTLHAIKLIRNAKAERMRECFRKKEDITMLD